MKKPIVALAHKMLLIFFAVLKNKTISRQAVDCEALSVQRNAPRWMTMLSKHGYMPTAA